MLEKARQRKSGITSAPASTKAGLTVSPVVSNAPETSKPGQVGPGREKLMQTKSMQGNIAKGLSGKLLVMTMAFVMIAEILIFVPSVANFRNVWLQSHLDTAETATIVYLDSNDTMLSGEGQMEVLRATESLNVSIKEGDVSRLMASSIDFAEVTEHIDLGRMQLMKNISSTLSTLFFGGNRTYHVYAPMKSREGTIHLVQHDKYLRSALLKYARNILLISLAISIFTATLVFFALYRLIVLPIIKISGNMDEFSKTPENANLIYRPTGRSDEIGIAEQRLAALQSDLQATLRQKQHLADLGLAVSKINHDLRNILASAQLFSDRLSQLPDPTVQRFAPKLLRTIDRAVEYTRSVLAYGKATESSPELRLHRLHTIVEDVGDILGLVQADMARSQIEERRGGPPHNIEWINAVPSSLQVQCDSEQLFRIILNICQNAVQVMQADLEDSVIHRIEVKAQAVAGFTDIRVIDTGPGIPPHQSEKLFKAFQGSGRSGGTGLGLVIAAELAKAHGGSIELEKTGSTGSVFLIRLPMGD